MSFLLAGSLVVSLWLFLVAFGPSGWESFCNHSFHITGFVTYGLLIRPLQIPRTVTVRKAWHPWLCLFFYYALSPGALAPLWVWFPFWLVRGHILCRYSFITALWGIPGFILSDPNFPFSLIRRLTSTCTQGGHEHGILGSCSQVKYHVIGCSLILFLYEILDLLCLGFAPWLYTAFLPSLGPSIWYGFLEYGFIPPAIGLFDSVLEPAGGISDSFYFPCFLMISEKRNCFSFQGLIPFLPSAGIAVWTLGSRSLLLFFPFSASWPARISCSFLLFSR